MDVMKACSQGGYYICGMDWRSLDWTRRVADGGDTRQLSVLHLPPKHWSNLRFSGPVQSKIFRSSPIYEYPRSLFIARSKLEHLSKLALCVTKQCACYDEVML